MGGQPPDDFIEHFAELSRIIAYQETVSNDEYRQYKLIK